MNICIHNFYRDHPFNIGDKLIAIRDSLGDLYRKGDIAYVCNDRYIRLNKGAHKIIKLDPNNFEKLHEGKVLIMVDEKDNNKIVARDLVTGKKAEAKRNPNDEWNFEKGAKLAFERLYPEKKEEKPKYWTGKVVCIKNGNEEHGNFLYWSGNPFFTVGKVYKVIDGRIMHDGTKDGECIPLQTVTSLENLLNPDSIERPFCCRFIEYKGGAEE